MERTEKDRAREYRTCRHRGHEPTNVTITTDPPWMICKHCGTSYRYEQQIIELNAPTERV